MVMGSFRVGDSRIRLIWIVSAIATSNICGMRTVHGAEEYPMLDFSEGSGREYRTTKIEQGAMIEEKFTWRTRRV